MEKNLPPEIATRSAWQNYPIDQPKRIEIALQFTPEQAEQMKLGLIPQQMEDKWFIFYEDEWLYFHRSWTGHGTYKAKLLKDGKEYAINEFYAERNTNKYSNEDEDYDIETLFFIIARGLLKIDSQTIYTALDMKLDEGNVISKWSSLGRMLFS